MAFAVGALWFAHFSVQVERNGTPIHLLALSESTATQLLAAIIGAMISLAGLVFALLPLIMQIASSQLSPRVLRLWYRRPEMKVTFGVFVWTLLYAFSLLTRLREGFVPQVSVTLAALFVLVSLVVFLTFINQFARKLTPAWMASSVVLTGRRVILQAYPPLLQDDEVETQPEPGLRPVGFPSRVVVNPGIGRVILGIDERGLVRRAKRTRGMFRLPFAVGDFVRQGAPLIEIYGDLREVESRALLGCVALGTERTLEQDPAFAFRLLVDIAIKALSPAINDPTTALQMIDRIEDLLAVLASRRLRHRELRDDAGRVRVLMPSPTWQDYLELAVVEIMSCGRDSPQVLRRLRAMLTGLDLAVPPGRRPAIARELQKLDATVQDTFPEGEDRRFASTSDYQGIGLAAREPPTEP